MILVLKSSIDIKTGNVVLFVPSGNQKQNILLPKNTFSQVFSYKDLDFDGTFKVLSSTGRFIYQIEYKDKKLNSYSIIKPSSNELRSNRTNSDCVDWWLVTTYHYPDGSSYTTREYVGKTCGDCGGDYMSFCQPDSGGGGGSNATDDQQDNVTYVEADSDDPQVSVGGESTDPNTGIITQNIAYSWKCGKGYALIFRSIYNWIYKSYETAVIEKYNSNDQWKFKANSFSHSSIQIIGVTPLNYDYSTSLGFAIFDHFNGDRQAKVAMEYTVYQRINGSAIGLGQNKSWTVPASQTFNAP